MRYANATRSFNAKDDSQAWHDDADVGLKPISSLISDTLSYNALGANAIGNAANQAKPVASIAQLANYLVNGFWESTGDIAHHWSSSTVTFNIDDLSVSEQSLALSALNAWHDIANLTFERTSGNADIAFSNNGSMQAFTNYNWDGNGHMTFASVNISSNWITSDGGAYDGYTGIYSYGYQTYLHEIGHALGLGHQGPYNGSARYGFDNVFANDSWRDSVMSYFDQGEAVTGTRDYVITPMLADIVAIQSIYGANTGTRTTNTTYGFHSTAGSLYDFGSYSHGTPAFTIYDSGGIDTLDCSGYTTTQTIDLAAAAYCSVGGFKNNIAIATNTTIENATGGSGADTIFGNGERNILDGGAGADWLNGKGGIDTAYGCAGNDAFILDNVGDGVFETAGNGTDTVYSSVNYSLAAGQSIEVLSTMGSATTAAINLTGNEIANAVVGNAAANRLDGGGGIDKMYGYGGNDSFLIDDVGDQVIEATGNGTDTVYSSVNYSLAPGQSIEVLSTMGSATTAAISLAGNELANAIVGNGGANALNGAGGNDTLYGFGGADIFRFNTALSASANVDRIVDYNVAADTIQLENGIFTALTATGSLNPNAFFIGIGAHDTDDRIIYNADTGALIYDSNGSAGGGAVQFAILTAHLALTNVDFVIV